MRLDRAGAGISYKDAGVDIDAKMAAIDRVKERARATLGTHAGPIGHFGGTYLLPGGGDRMLVASADGVGTKLRLAFALGGEAHAAVGRDIVNHCANDILALGAQPLFFLDYFATGKLAPEQAEQVVAGIAAGCRLAGCALIGGETAEMPGMYGPGHYDLAGFCVGAVERERIVDPARITRGAALVGLPSSGPHSNGYSLIRKLVADLDLAADPGGLGTSLGEALLAPTRIYVRELLTLHARDQLLGAAHITGGGFTGNVPRMLPPGLGAVLRRGSWPTPPVFDLLRRLGGLTDAEMHQTFNNGLGMVIAVPAADADAVARELGGHVVGEVVDDPAGEARVR